MTDNTQELDEILKKGYRYEGHEFVIDTPYLKQAITDWAEYNIEAYVTTRVKEALQNVLNEYAKQYQKHLLDMGRSGKTPLTIFHKIINTQYKALTTTTNGKEE